MESSADREILPANHGKEVSHHEVTDLEVIEPQIERIVEQKIELRMERFNGPMPHPDHLARYDKLVPGCARMIMDEFQANSRHGRQLEIMGLSGMVNKDTRAQWMAFILVLVSFFLIWQLATHDHERVAIAVAISLVGSIVTAFLTTKRPADEKKKAVEVKDSDASSDADTEGT
ncbi:MULTISPECIES: DUF2335 domain-containing protein [Burkholderia]|uniref:DUF2335 domain-containing protein n=1 Tax=Burkholderia TaxID=32008 RepID=UPI001F43C651|nr:MULTISPECIES: DUF2335 domain-containing protein [Burkholderia]